MSSKASKWILDIAYKADDTTGVRGSFLSLDYFPLRSQKYFSGPLTGNDGH